MTSPQVTSRCSPESKGNSGPAAAESRSVTGRVRRVLETGVVCVHLVAGTLALVDAYVKKKERQEQKELEYSIRGEWQRALIQSGMSPELARHIRLKFSADMIRFIVMQRFPQAEDTRQIGVALDTTSARLALNPTSGRSRQSSCPAVRARSPLAIISTRDLRKSLCADGLEGTFGVRCCSEASPRFDSASAHKLVYDASSSPQSSTANSTFLTISG